MTLLSPDCEAGKHTACSGDAWDHQLDAPASCQCPAPGCTCGLQELVDLVGAEVTVTPQPDDDRDQTVTGPGGVQFPAAALVQHAGPANRLGGCAGCGGCCTHLTLEIGPDAIAQELANLEAVEADEAAGYPRAEAWTDRHRVTTRWMAQLESKGERVFGRWAYSCPLLDPESRLCTAHERRPVVCSGFPFYGRPPAEDPAEMSDGCSYQWELPVELRAPLTGGTGVGGIEGPTGPVGRLIPLWPV